MDIGKILIILGSIILIAGLSISYAPWLVSWFGRLPGDIHIKKENSTVFFPFSSMIVTKLNLESIF